MTHFPKERQKMNYGRANLGVEVFFFSIPIQKYFGIIKTKLPTMIKFIRYKLKK